MIVRLPVALLLAAAISLAAGAGSASAVALPFDLPAVAIDVGDGAIQVLVGDVDGDGRKDVALIKSETRVQPQNVTGEIVVQFGRAGGGFGGTAVSGGLPPYRGKLGDTNGDGASEVIALHYQMYLNLLPEALVWRLLPDRSLGLVATIVPPAGVDGFNALASGDFDADGDDDVAFYAGSNAYLYRSDPGDVFTFVQSVNVGTASFGREALSGDFNGDGRDDVVFNASGGAVALLFSGPGFAHTVRTDDAGNSSGLAAADLDGDAALDLIHLKPTVLGDDRVEIRKVALVRGSTFLKFAELTPDNDIRCASGGDVDGDGLMDVLTGSGTLRAILWNRNLGDGTYAPAVARPAGGTPSRIAWIDLDGDGADDPIAACSAGLAAAGFLSGPGAFAPPPAIASAAEPIRVEAGDFDGDGGRDFAVLGSSPPASVAIHTPQPGDTWSRTDVPFGSVGRDLRVTDLDEDGASDLVVLLGGGTPHVVVRRSDGAGGFLAPVEFEAPGALTVDAADLDSDGDLDLLALAPNSGRAWPLLGDGTGAFVPAADFAVPVGARGFVLLDVSEDGRRDLVTADGGNGTVSVLHGAGPGLVFGPPVSHPAGGAADVIRTIDADGDGRLDVVVAGTPGPVALLRRLGPDTFSSPLVQPATGLNLSDLRVGYFDGDAYQDIVALTSFTATGLGGCVHFLRGNGDGTLDHAGAWFTGRDPRGLAFADVAASNALDVLVTQNDGTVLLLPNMLADVVGVPAPFEPGIASFALRVSPSPATGPIRVELAGRPYAVARIEVFAVDGRRVGEVHELRAGDDGRVSVVVDAPGRAGVYLVRATQDDGRVAVKRAVVLE